MIALTATRRERVVACAVLAGALVFVALALPRVGSAGLVGALTLPGVALAADLVLAAALLTGWYPIRPVAQGLAVFGLLLHGLVALRSGPVWTRGLSGLLALAHGWALVLLFLLTAEEQDTEELDTEEQDTEEQDAADEEWPEEDRYEAVETPVSELVEVAPARDRPAETEEHAR